MPKSQVPLSDRGWDDFLETYAEEIRSAAVRACPRDAGVAADELAQEIRLRLWKARPSAKEIEDPASYIRRVAATAAIDAVRRVRARKEEPLRVTPSAEDSGAVEPKATAPETSPERVAASRELARALSGSLQRLSPERQRPVRLYLQGFSAGEAAVLLGWTEARTRMLLYRGLEDLRKDLRRMGIDR
jgi:RNA polymerase sigma-70 factor (ECF subfamily)